MSEISVSNLSFSFGENVILKNASFELYPGDKAGLVGPNGCGKSTLLNLIIGRLYPDSGNINIPKNRTVSLLEQIPNYPDDMTVRDVLLTAFERIYAQKAEIDKLSNELYKGNKDDLRRFGELQNSFEASGGYELDRKYALMTQGLHIPEEMQSRPFESLSGGEKTRVNLARILLSEPDILLLDEPTNHLDIDSIEWLEEQIISFKGTVLTVSHDRFFLDKVTTKTLELYENGIITYPGNYSYFAEKRSEKAEQLEAEKRRQDKEIARLTDASERMKIWGRGNKRVMKKAFAIQKRIERMEKIRTIRKERKINAHFELAARSGDEVMNIEKLSLGYSRTLLEGFSAQVLRGERIAILGVNGCGKTTLMETLIGEKAPLSGYVFDGSNVKKGYLPQVVSFDYPEKNVLDTVLFDSGCSTQEARDRLAIYDFRGDEVFKTVQTLSGGEKTRLKLCLFMSRNVNTLFLDEPTNHLDIMSRSWVEDAIDEYSETLIFVSHDRYFIDRFATRIWLFENGKITDFDGSYQEFREMLRRREELAKAVPVKKDTPDKPQPAKEKKPSSKEKRQLNAKIALLEKELDSVSAEIEANPSDYIKLGALLPKKDELENALLELYEQVEE